VSKLRSGLTYANVIATLALFLALGGGAYAVSKLPKNSVGTPQLKKNAVRSGKVKNGAVRGPDVNEATLGKVPAARRADTAGTAGRATSASSAASANNAKLLAGQHAPIPLEVNMPNGAGTNDDVKLIDSLDGQLTILGSCPSGSSVGNLVFASAVPAALDWFYSTGASTPNAAGTGIAPGDDRSFGFARLEGRFIYHAFPYTPAGGSGGGGVKIIELHAFRNGTGPNSSCQVVGEVRDVD
jgi:hypothetical protein